VTKKKRRANPLAGARRDLASLHGVIIEDCLERRSPHDYFRTWSIFKTCFGSSERRDFQKKETRRFLPPYVAFHDAVSRCSTSWTIEKENTRKTCVHACIRACVHACVLRECIQRHVCFRLIEPCDE